MSPSSPGGLQPLSYLLEGQLGLTHRKFLQIIEDNFLVQVVKEPMRRGGLLDLTLTSQEGLVEDVKIGAVLAVVTVRW